VGVQGGDAADPGWAAELEELRVRLAFARAMGGPEAVDRQHSAGRLTIRERIERLADADTFEEVGALAGRAVHRPDGTLETVTPANFLFGSLEIDGRAALVTGYDYTVRGGAIEGGLMDKRPYAERMAHDLKVPLVRLVEGVGASVRGSTRWPTCRGCRWCRRRSGHWPASRRSR
jgi:acetyl-CoA carboxylase carboxyltransferase component